MKRKNIYLLVPVKGNSFKAGLAADKVRLHVGRGAKKDAAREAFERELNGGQTWHEMLAACKSKEDFTKMSTDAWQVHDDTWSSWANFTGSEHWPVQKEVEALFE